jgi:hypothetical protein
MASIVGLPTSLPAAECVDSLSFNTITISLPILISISPVVLLVNFVPRIIRPFIPRSFPLNVCDLSWRSSVCDLLIFSGARLGAVSLVCPSTLFFAFICFGFHVVRGYATEFTICAFRG